MDSRREAALQRGREIAARVSHRDVDDLVALAKARARAQARTIDEGEVKALIRAAKSRIRPT